jgi:polyisoprenoid-binding protein YceI
MKKIILIMYFIVSLVNARDVEKDENCVLVKTGSAEIGFEGYKTEFKAGISANFDKIEYKLGSKDAKNLSEFFLGSSVVIDKNSIQIEEEPIEKNLVEFFFNLLDGDKITANILEVKPLNSKRGKLSISISMNGVTKNVEMLYFLKRNMLYGLGRIELADFNASEALSSLNKACFDMHLGKTWSDVGINFKIPIEKVCKKPVK